MSYSFYAIVCRADETVRLFNARVDVKKHLHMIKLEALQPLLLGRAQQSEVWLKYAHDAQLIASPE